MPAISVVGDPHRRWHGGQDRLQFRRALVGEAVRLSQLLDNLPTVTDVRLPTDSAHHKPRGIARTHARVQYSFTRARFAAFALHGGCRLGPLELGNVRDETLKGRPFMGHGALR
jgi:hypothetical protein